jgi:hypothetical protein
MVSRRAEHAVVLELVDLDHHAVGIERLRGALCTKRFTGGDRFGCAFDHAHQIEINRRAELREPAQDGALRGRKGKVLCPRCGVQKRGDTDRLQACELLALDHPRAAVARIGDRLLAGLAQPRVVGLEACARPVQLPAQLELAARER